MMSRYQDEPPIKSGGALIAGLVSLALVFGIALAGLGLKVSAQTVEAKEHVSATTKPTAPITMKAARPTPTAQQSTRPPSSTPTPSGTPTAAESSTETPTPEATPTAQPTETEWSPTPDPAPVETYRPQPRPQPQPQPRPQPRPVGPTTRPVPPAPNDEGIVSGGDYGKLADAINAERVKAGLSALTYSDSLEKNAIQCAVSNARAGGLSHSLPGCGYEDLYMDYYRYPSAEKVVGVWMNSPGHRAAIMNTHTTTIAIGYAYKSGSGFVVAGAFR